MANMLVTRSIDARIAVVADTSAGVVSEFRLRTAGIERRRIRHRLGLGTLVEVLPRTYARIEVAQLDERQRRVAAVESLQHHRGVLALTTAGAAHRIWRRDRTSVVHVVSRTKWRPCNVPWVSYHSTDDLADDDIVSVDGSEVTGVVRTCLDLGMVLTQWQLAHVLYEAEFLHDLDLDELERRNEARASYRGCAVVRAAIAHRRAGSAGTRSASEDYFLDGITRAGLDVPDICNPNATEIRSIECDAVWRRARVIVEIDGPGHRRSGRAARDADQVRALERLGWRVIRVDTDGLWRDRDAVISMVSAALLAAEVH